MNQLITLWLALDARRRVVFVLSTVAMFVAVLVIARAATTPTEALLFSRLDGSAAGEVISALDQRGIKYSVRGNAIYVPSIERDQLRLSLAGEGLPASGASGYELLDNLSGFGTTSQIFDTAYWRAMEGELARTILSSPQIRTARVHIGRESNIGFGRTEVRTASIAVTATNGLAISSSQANALKYMVGSAVSGLMPENVSVIDGQSGTVFSSDTNEAGNLAEDSRASALKLSVERLLEARVGPGNVVVEVSVETNLDTESISERIFDPDSRVAISTETEENTLDATEPTPGVTVASNLPAGDVAGGTGGRSRNNQTVERTNFEVSETQREVLRVPGAIRRLSVAVLVDGVSTVNPEGQAVVEPRSAQELDDLKALVASAVGFDEARGDMLTIHSMLFQTLPSVGTEAAPSFLQKLDIDVMQILQISILAVVVLVLAFGIVRPIALSAATAPPQLVGPDGARVDPLRAIDGEIDPPSPGNFASTLPAVSANNPSLTDSNISSLDDIAEDPVARLRQLIEDRQVESVDILRGWMEKDQENV